MKPDIPLQYILTGQARDRDSDKAKAKEQKSQIDFEPPKQDQDKKTDQQSDIGKVTEVEDLLFQNLTLGQDKLKEELLEVTDSLVPPAMASAMADATTKDTDGALTDQEL